MRLRLLFALLFITTIIKAQIYVAKDATGANDGSSWADAYTNLQTALNLTPTGSFWVKAGTYVPGGTRASSFILSNNQKIYGGFNGTEVNFSQRNTAVNITTLSGDINGDDNEIFSTTDSNRAENSYRIINVNGTNVVIDGFDISNGNANGANAELQEGSGVAVTLSTNLEINNCKFIRHTLNRGGVIRAIDVTGAVNIKINNSTFKDNESLFATVYYGRAGADLDVKFEGCLFTDNTSVSSTGSLIWLRQDTSGSQTAIIINSTFSGNVLDASRAVIDKLSVSGGAVLCNIYNSIFWNNGDSVGNFSDALESGTSGSVGNSISNDGFTSNSNTSNVSSANPLFTDATNEDYNLQTISPALDTGDNSFVNNSTDILGNQRILNTIVDMGAYEFGSSLPVNRTLTINATNGAVTTNPNPTNGTYPDGTSVTLSATADAGYQFTGWSGDATGNTNPLNITMDADKTIAAMFSIIKRSLTIVTPDAPAGSVKPGTVTINPFPTNGGYDNGTLVTLTAVPGIGYKFDGFRNNISGANLALNRGNPLSTIITMNEDKSITALFSKIQRTLSINATNGSVTANPNPINGTYDDGIVVTLTATPFNNFAFVNWSGDITANATSISVTMDANKTITANFNSTLRIDDEEFVENEFEIYPNPINDFLNISTDLEVKNIIVYNVLGKTIIKSTLASLNVSSLKSGIYLLKMETKQGEIAIKRFIKK